MLLRVLLLCCAFLWIAQSYVTVQSGGRSLLNSPRIPCSSSCSSQSFTLRPLHAAKSYEEMLAEARARKQVHRSSPPSVVNAASSTSGLKATASAVTVSRVDTPSVAREATQPTSAPTTRKEKSNLPFDDEIYEHLKFVISKLTAKIKSDVSLTPDELVRFKQAVDSIVADAIGEIPPSENASIAASNVAEKSTTKDNVPDPSSPFSLMHGKTSTWEVDNMENMTTEEFYDAINKRNAEIRARLKASRPRVETDDYFEHLNSRSGSKQ